MPRITNMIFTKDYKTVVDGLATMLKNAEISDEHEHAGKKAVDIEGDFSTLDLRNMDVWEGHIKFTVQDNEGLDSDEMAAKASLATALPELAHTLFSPTIAKVYKRVEVTIRTTTIIERLIDGKSVSCDEQITKVESSIEWEDVTLELGRIFDESR